MTPNDASPFLRVRQRTLSAAHRREVSGKRG